MRFNFSSITDNNKSKNSKKSNFTNYVILEREVWGVVYITLNATYYVKLDDGRIYDIAPKCYKIGRRKTIYFRKLLDGQPAIYRRVNTRNLSIDNCRYLPFGVGCRVKCNIVEDPITKRHKVTIKICRVDYLDERFYTAVQYLKKNYAIIKPKMDDIENKRLYGE